MPEPPERFKINQEPVVIAAIVGGIGGTIHGFSAIKSTTDKIQDANNQIRDKRTEIHTTADQLPDIPVLVPPAGRIFVRSFVHNEIAQHHTEIQEICSSKPEDNSTEAIGQLVGTVSVSTFALASLVAAARYGFYRRTLRKSRKAEAEIDATASKMVKDVHSFLNEPDSSEEE